MEDWERDIIIKNLKNLIHLTVCNETFISILYSNGVLGIDDLNELESQQSNTVSQAYKFYNILLTRERGFEGLLHALRETKQTGAVNILEAEAIRLNSSSSLNDIGSLTYDIYSILGKGSSGTTVFKGKLGNREVAVKRVQFNVLGIQATHEVEMLKCCDVHENIVRYFGSKQVQDDVLIVLELCDMTLRQWVMQKTFHINPIEVLRQATSGLEWLHQQRIVHRDLKPENILLICKSKFIWVKISDFGLSRRILDGRSGVTTTALAGTQGYIAPEILVQAAAPDIVHDRVGQGKFTYASDIFALGCVYYFVLTGGKHPFGESLRQPANILDNKVMIYCDDILHSCCQNVLFVRLMISKTPKARPSCESLLYCPLFWFVDRSTRFFDDLKNKGYCDDALLQALKLQCCPKSGGYGLPFAYLKGQSFSYMEQYYITPSGFEINELTYMIDAIGEDLQEYTNKLRQ